MQKAKLDQIDLKILTELQGNGRITNVELARRVDISAPPCLRRVRALEEGGFIKGYHAELNAKALGYEVTSYVLVAMSKHADTDLKAFETFAKGHPSVRECHLVQGDHDFLVKCTTHTLEAYQRFLTEELLAQPNVGHVKTMLVVRSGKNEPGVPIG